MSFFELSQQQNTFWTMIIFFELVSWLIIFIFRLSAKKHYLYFICTYMMVQNLVINNSFLSCMFTWLVWHFVVHHTNNFFVNFFYNIYNIHTYLLQWLLMGVLTRKSCCTQNEQFPFFSIIILWKRKISRCYNFMCVVCSYLFPVYNVLCYYDQIQK